MKTIIIAAVIMLMTIVSVTAQDLYSTDEVQKIELRFDQPNFWDLLEANKDSEIEIPAVFVLNNDYRIDSVGVRFKGNSSYNVQTDKKSFNISLDAYNKDARIEGYKTLNLNNNFMDPTFTREIITNEIFSRYMPALKVGYVRLYINGEYWGLYTNVQQVNKDYLGEWFNSKAGNLYKGDPHGALRWKGNDPNLYKSDYEKKTNENEDDWTDLVDLINKINNSTNLEQELPQILDVDRYLWYMALCNILINLDSYIFSGHNYYIYNVPATGRFSFIPWDLNEAFGGFPPQMDDNQRNSFPILNNQMPNPPSLVTAIGKSEEFKARYYAHYRTILNESFIADSLLRRINQLQALIDQWVKQDTKKLYSYQNFKDNVTENILADKRYVPGIFSLVQNRSNFLKQQQVLTAPAAVISNIQHTPDIPEAGTQVLITAQVESSTALKEVRLYSRFMGQAFGYVLMQDDGVNDDGTAGNGIFGAKLNIPEELAGADLEYYIYALTQNMTAALSPERAEYEFHSIATASSGDLPDVVINEFMASNQTTITDEEGKYEDWVELYNRSNFEINLEGMYLTDDLAEPKKWQFPAVTIPPKGYLLIWADKDLDATEGLHADIKLSKDGEQVGLFDTDANQNALIDSYTFGAQTEDVSEGRWPNGFGDFILMEIPTPGAENQIKVSVTETESTEFKIYPNPAANILQIQLSNSNSPAELRVTDIFGNVVKTANIYDKNLLKLDISEFSEGIYFVLINYKSKLYREKFVIIK